MKASNTRFVFTHHGEMVQVSDEVSMSKALDSVPGVKRASDPLVFLIRNVGWGVLIHATMTKVTLRFNESTVTKAALFRMYEAIRTRIAIHQGFEVELVTNVMSASASSVVSGVEALNYLKAILEEVGSVSVNQEPIRQVPKPVESNDATMGVCEALNNSSRPTDDVFHIVKEAGFDHGEITSYFVDQDSGRFLFTHIGSNIRDRASLTDKAVAMEFLGRPIERAMGPQSAISLQHSLQIAQRNLYPLYEQCEMELVGQCFEYNRLTLPVVSLRQQNSVSHIITVVTDVRTL